MVKLIESAKAPRELRSKYKNDWVGVEKPLVESANATSLPTQKEVLACFLYFSKRNIKTKGSSGSAFDPALITAISIDQIWLKASLVPVNVRTIAAQVKKLYETYKSIRNTPKKQKTGPTYLKKSQEFKTTLLSLFNVFSGETLFKETEDQELEFLRSGFLKKINF